MADESSMELCCILEAAHRLLSLGQVAYQRDVYYRYRGVLRSVERVGLLCARLAAFLGVQPPQLRIIPCPKGVLFGRVSLELDDGSVVDFSGRNGHVLPPAESVQRVVFHRDVHTLVLTAFFALLQSGFGERFPDVLLATGKGYPDFNTRRLLAACFGTLDIAVLVDYDPDGAHIFQVYCEGGLDGSRVCMPNCRWAGLHCSMTRVGRWGLDVSRMIEFTARDRGLALRLMQHWSCVPALRRRMARMAYRGKKAELEVVTQFRAMALSYIESLIY
ncbi:endodeoxyribonuclease [Coemansia javaensis]|uniref:Endodeoxyribonuclease n=1 Tax=Coemansia javaensis TaxID=2761396 RepID=A0A9W8LEQ6_9FUNG|nr:endodeoxyribonuclease [Coemansia javaensis]